MTLDIFICFLNQCCTRHDKFLISRRDINATHYWKAFSSNIFCFYKWNILCCRSKLIIFEKISGLTGRIVELKLLFFPPGTVLFFDLLLQAIVFTLKPMILLLILVDDFEFTVNYILKLVSNVNCLLFSVQNSLGMLVQLISLDDHLRCETLLQGIPIVVNHIDHNVCNLTDLFMFLFIAGENKSLSFLNKLVH